MRRKFCHEILSLEEDKRAELPKGQIDRVEESNANHVVYYLGNSLQKVLFLFWFSPKLSGNIVMVFECI